jgi:hypothetical protein
MTDSHRNRSNATAPVTAPVLKRFYGMRSMRSMIVCAANMIPTMMIMIMCLTASLLILSLSFSLSLSPSLFAPEQARAQQFGGAAVPFISIGPDSRASGMGEASAGLADDLNAIHWNAGGLAFQYDRQFALNYSPWLPQFNAGLSFNNLAYSQYVSELGGTVYGSFTFMNLGEFIRTNINGIELGKFQSNEFALSIGYATKLSEDVGLGLTVKAILSNLGALSGNEVGAGTGFTGAGDLGILWRPSKLNLLGLDLSDRLGLGATLVNMGPAITYNRFADPIPQKFRAGISIDLLRDEYNELTLVWDVAKLLVDRDSSGEFRRFPISIGTGFLRGGIETGGGIEYWYDKTVALRGGYFTEPVQIGGRRFFTVGLGVHLLDIFYPNFSFILPIEQNSPLANTARISLTINFNNGAQLAGQKTP